MKVTRYIVGIVGLLLCWIAVALVVGIVMAIVFPPVHAQNFVVGIGLDWRNLPGAVLGLLAGLHSFRASSREPRG